MLLENFSSFDDILSESIITVLNDTFSMAGSMVLLCPLRDWNSVVFSVKPLDLSVL